MKEAQNIEWKQSEKIVFLRTDSNLLNHDVPAPFFSARIAGLLLTFKVSAEPQTDGHGMVRRWSGAYTCALTFKVPQI